TGWIGGAYGVGKRIDIASTRRLLSAALDGDLDQVDMRFDPLFGFEVPMNVPGVEDRLLDPRRCWADGDAYDAQAARLVSLFRQNVVKFGPDANAEAGPHLQMAAE